MKSLIHFVAASLVAITCACKPTAASSGPVLTVDSVALADSMSNGRSTAEVTISGLYPDSGATALVTNSRQWLAECLSWGTFSDSKPVIRPTQAEINNPDRLLAHLAQQILASANRTFIELNELPDARFGFEYKITFEPVYVTDSLVTYVYSSYGYEGGAHGNSVMKAATFLTSNGRQLTYDNTILPDRRKELIAKIRTALWEQYFLPTAADPGAPETLEQALLINPAELDLPVNGPQFGKDGITFTYGQYEIAPYSAGMPSCTISYQDLHPLMQAWILPAITNNCCQ